MADPRGSSPGGELRELLLDVRNSFSCLMPGAMLTRLDSQLAKLSRAVEVVSEGPPRRTVAEILRDPPTLKLEAAAIVPAGAALCPNSCNMGPCSARCSLPAGHVTACLCDDCMQWTSRRELATPVPADQRPVRSARELAHEATNCNGWGKGGHDGVCDAVTAAIEADRASRGVPAPGPVAGCTRCGWKSAPQPDGTSAWIEADKHAREVHGDAPRVPPASPKETP